MLDDGAVTLDIGEVSLCFTIPHHDRIRRSCNTHGNPKAADFNVKKTISEELLLAGNIFCFVYMQPTKTNGALPGVCPLAGNVDERIL